MLPLPSQTTPLPLPPPEPGRTRPATTEGPTALTPCGIERRLVDAAAVATGAGAGARAGADVLVPFGTARPSSPPEPPHAAPRRASVATIEAVAARANIPPAALRCSTPNHLRARSGEALSCACVRAPRRPGGPSVRGRRLPLMPARRSTVCRAVRVPARRRSSRGRRRERIMRCGLAESRVAFLSDLGLLEGDPHLVHRR